ncbi:unnamed protein product [Arctia plantaginis]|uniref:CCHC-type domain-containing protein n=1 Tax=Arctia plantaginis TaxID=874455 RepID=A0A8S1AKY4_ARCPL|nr:unnamed protein product [Arctia plantaginis]
MAYILKHVRRGSRLAAFYKRGYSLEASSLIFSEEVRRAKAENKPIVALESTIITHGMPYPQNIDTALQVESIIRELGAVPATIAILKGQLTIGLSEDQIRYLAKAKGVVKASRRDLAPIAATKLDGATTVAGTIIAAELADIPVFVTGGIVINFVHLCTRVLLLMSGPNPTSEVGYDCPPTSGTSSAQNMQENSSLPSHSLETILSKLTDALLPRSNAPSHPFTVLVPFDPDDLNLDIEGWCRLTDAIIKGKTVKGLDLIITLTHGLRGRAATLLTKIPPSQYRWEDIQETLKAQFSRPMLIQDHFDSILKFQITANETPAQSCLRLWQLIENIPDTNLPEKVVTGFAVSVLSQCDVQIRRELNSTVVNDKSQLFRVLRGISLKRKSKFSEPNDSDVKRSRATFPFRGNCHVCDKPGHRAADCRERNKTNGSMITDKRVNQRHQVTCYVCGEPGHIVSTCPKRVDYTKKEQAATGSKEVKVCSKIVRGALDCSGFTPMELMFGIQGSSLNLAKITPSSSEPTLINVKAARSSASENIQRVANADTLRFNKGKARIKPFAVGEFVFVKSEERHQSKLDKKFKGPYKIITVLDNDRYELKHINGSNRIYKFAHENLRGVPKGQEGYLEIYEYSDESDSTDERTVMADDEFNISVVPGNSNTTSEETVTVNSPILSVDDSETLSRYIESCTNIEYVLFLLGGVHRQGENTLDISADLNELGRSKTLVVCSGVKSILDIGRTLEYLETQGVCVCAFGQSTDFPAFYTPKSGYRAPHRVSDAQHAAKLLQAAYNLRLNSGIVVAVPIPQEFAMNEKVIEVSIQRALKEAAEKGIQGKEVTPFLLSAVAKATGGASLNANIALIKNNAKVGANIAVELKKLKNVGNSFNSKVGKGSGGNSVRHFHSSSRADCDTDDAPLIEPSKMCDGDVLVIGGANVDRTYRLKEERVQVVVEYWKVNNTSVYADPRTLHGATSSLDS